MWAWPKANPSLRIHGMDSIRPRDPGLQAPSNLTGKIRITHFFPPNEFLSRDVMSNIKKSAHHVSCLYSEGKAIAI